MNVLQASSCEKAVSRILLRVGTPPRAVGFAYLKCAVCLILESDKPQKLSRDVYPKTAQRFGVRPAAVERAIRLAIGQTIDSERFAELDEVLGGVRVPGKDKPTNAEFIFGVAEYLRNNVL